MLRHPVDKVSLRSLVAEQSTWLFMLFSALIVSLFIVLQGVGQAQRGDVFAEDDRILIVSNEMAPRYPLPVRYADEINREQIPGVERAVAINFVPATMNGARRRIGAMAADPADLLRTNTDLIVPGGAAQRWIDDRNSLLVGRDFAAREGLRIGDELSIDSPLFREAGGEPTIKFRVGGLYSIKDDAYPALGVVMHDKLIRPQGQLTAAQGASAILVLLTDRGSAAEASRRIDAMYNLASPNTRTTLREQFVETFNNQGAGIKTLLRLYGFGGIGAGVMLLLAFCYFNAYRLEKELRRFQEMGFQRLGVMARAAASMTLVMLLGAVAGTVGTLGASELFDVAIQRNFPYFDPSWQAGAWLLPIVAIATFALSTAALETVGALQRRALRPEAAR